MRLFSSIMVGLCIIGGIVFSFQGSIAEATAFYCLAVMFKLDVISDDIRQLRDR